LDFIVGARDISAHGKKLQRKIEVIKQMYFSLTQDYHDARIMQLDREIYDFLFLIVEDAYTNCFVIDCAVCTTIEGVHVFL
jgi:hypothetical protein